MSRSIPQELAQNFLNHTPTWYKLTILGFLLLNPVLLMTVGPFVTGWVLILEFIFTLAMALKSYPLQPGGLLAMARVKMNSKISTHPVTNGPTVMINTGLRSRKPSIVSLYQVGV